MEQREWGGYDDDDGFVPDNDVFQANFKDVERTGKGIGGVFMSTIIDGNTKLAKLAKKISKLMRTDHESFVMKAQRSVHLLNHKCNFNIELSQVDNLLILCQKIQDEKYKSSLGIILARKYYSSNDDYEREEILKCASELRISIVDITKYIRLLKKYKIIITK